MRKMFVLLTAVFISLNIMPVKAMEKTSETLKKNVVTEGEGLYVDPTIEGRYIYKGGNPNNYIKLGNDLYRIISLEKDGTIKVIKNESIGSKAWDEENVRYSTDSNDFCTSEYGCKSWGSKTTTLDSSGNKVTQMPWEVNGTLKNLPEKEASLNTYLNNDWYNTLDKDVQDLIVTKDWNIGPTAYNQTNLSDSMKEEAAYKWKGKIALMNVTDYVKGSSNNACTSVLAYVNKYGYPSTCYKMSNTHNYLYAKDWNGKWMISSYSTSIYETASTYVFSACGGGCGESNYCVGSGSVGYGKSVLPAFYLSSNTSLEGSGTLEQPYTIEKYIEDKEEIKGGQTGSENKVEDNNKEEVDVVQVPSTSAEMSIIIASMGVIFIACAALLTRKVLKK